MEDEIYTNPSGLNVTMMTAADTSDGLDYRLYILYLDTDNFVNHLEANTIILLTDRLMYFSHARIYVCIKNLQIINTQWIYV